eukprot:jgi/Galph1/1516/GphlegSOOS_G211.1
MFISSFVCNANPSLYSLPPISNTISVAERKSYSRCCHCRDVLRDSRNKRLSRCQLKDIIILCHFQDRNEFCGPEQRDIKKQEIQWYPGHIAKAERALKDKLKLVDVVLEVRDSRIPKSTGHPNLEDWLQGKKRLVVLNRSDTVSRGAQALWTQKLSQQGFSIFCTDAKSGKGVDQLKKALIRSGDEVNSKRKSKGLLPRAIRCAVIGFPNVGKSALINRLLKRSVVKSENRPGVTRTFQWINVSEHIQLLDSPGIIPPKLVSQESAQMLAFCDDIGHGSYDIQVIAAALFDAVRLNIQLRPHDGSFSLAKERFGPDLMNHSGEQLLEIIANRSFGRNKEKAAQRLVADFRQGLWGRICLEWDDEIVC